MGNGKDDTNDLDAQIPRSDVSVAGLELVLALAFFGGNSSGTKSKVLLVMIGYIPCGETWDWACLAEVCGFLDLG
jgi:hypothetical protein